MGVHRGQGMMPGFVSELREDPVQSQRGERVWSSYFGSRLTQKLTR